MAIGESFLMELEQEAKATRAMLERVPADKFTWKPHEKSMTLSNLSAHVAEVPDWISFTLDFNEIDFAKFDYKLYEPKDTADLLRYFDENIAKAVETLKKTPDEVFMQEWTMRNGETVYFTLPKIVVLRSYCFNHLYHHRGQLSVYLRLLNVSLPQVYGPTADEGNM